MSCAESATKWYKSNFLKGNLNKYRTMTLENKNNPMENIVIDGYEVPSTVLIFFGYYLIVNYNLLNRLILFVLIKSNQRVGVLMRLRNMIPMHGNEITIIQDCHSSHSTLPNLLPPGMEFLSCE
jgi:hypothetical protein